MNASKLFAFSVFLAAGAVAGLACDESVKTDPKAAGSDAGQGLYIALNAPSDAARQFAAKNSIRIVTGTELAQLMGPTITAGSNGKRVV